MRVSYRVHHHNKRLGNLFGETYIRGLRVIHYACFI